MNIVKALYNEWKSSKFWENSFSRYVDGEIEAALLEIRKIEKMRPFAPDEKLLEGVLLHRLEKPDEAIKSLIWAFKHLDNQRSINTDEEKYLSVYILGLLKVISRKYQIDVDNFTVEKTDYNYDEKKVRPGYKWAFSVDNFTKRD